MAKKGEKMSIEYKNKISKGRKLFYTNGGIHNWLGKSLSEETKKIISEKAMGNKRRIGFKNSKEHNEIIRKSMLLNTHGFIHGLSKTKEYKRLNGHKAVLKSYGVTVEEYNKLVIKQKGLCKICGSFPKRKLSLDHDHKTGKIRGLLCNSCNMALGLFKDNTIFLLRASKYLNYAKSNTSK